MQMPDIVTLIVEDPKAHGVGENPTLTGREVYCLVRSVGMTERYQAMANGFNPSLVFTLRDAEDYRGEKILIYKKIFMRVVRTYKTGRGIEITCEETTVDAAVAKQFGEENVDADA